MGMFPWTIFALVSFYLIFFTYNNVSATSTHLTFNTIKDDTDICKIVFCGKGTCVPSIDELLGFTCVCDHGWKKINISSFVFPPCVIPNCTVDLKDGNGTLPPAPPVLPPNLTNLCLLNLCLDGTCVGSGLEYKCQCNEGSANLLNNTKFPCLKKSSLGVDCNGLDLGFDPPATQNPAPSSAAPSSGFGSPSTGLGGMLNCSTELYILIMTLLAIIFQNWI